MVLDLSLTRGESEMRKIRQPGELRDARRLHTANALSFSRASWVINVVSAGTVYACSFIILDSAREEDEDQRMFVKKPST